MRALDRTIAEPAVTHAPAASIPLAEGKIRGRIGALDGLRAIAVALVLAGHGSEAYLGHSRSIWLAPLCNSSLGVRLFFVLSGFLITGLLVREHEKHGRISLRDFYVRRTLRIFPAFYLFLAVVAGLAAMGAIETSWQQLLAAGTYTWNYLGVWYREGPSDGAWFLGHLWTLSLEEQFYVFWPGLIMLTGWKAARWVCLFLPLLMPAIRIGWYFAFPEQRGLLGMMFHTGIDSILVGCAIALWRDQIPRRVVEQRRFLFLAAIFVFVVSPVLAELVKPYRITVGFGLEAVGAAVLILHACRDGAWSRLLGWRPLALVGTWSYSLYLWQQLFLTPKNGTWSGDFPVSLLALTTCALVSFYCVEQPLLHFKRRFERASMND